MRPARTSFFQRCAAFHTCAGGSGQDTTPAPRHHRIAALPRRAAANFQPIHPLRYSPLPAEFFIENRRRLTALLPPGALVILHANDLMPTNADGTLGFAQNSDLYYLSGIDQEETVLMLFPDAPDPKQREVLLVRETTEEISIWEGEKLTQPQARERSGIQKVVWTSEFEALFRLFMCQAVGRLFERQRASARPHHRWSRASSDSRAAAGTSTRCTASSASLRCSIRCAASRARTSSRSSRRPAASRAMASCAC